MSKAGKGAKGNAEEKENLVKYPRFTYVVSVKCRWPLLTIE